MDATSGPPPRGGMCVGRHPEPPGRTHRASTEPPSVCRVDRTYRFLTVRRFPPPPYPPNDHHPLFLVTAFHSRHALATSYLGFGAKPAFGATPAAPQQVSCGRCGLPASPHSLTLTAAHPQQTRSLSAFSGGATGGGFGAPAAQTPAFGAATGGFGAPQQPAMGAFVAGFVGVPSPVDAAGASAATSSTSQPASRPAKQPKFSFNFPASSPAAAAGGGSHGKVRDGGST